MKTIILLGTRGIPPRHGAFEQFAEVFCEKYQHQFRIVVFCEGDGSLKTEHSVTQIFIKKRNFPGYAIIYDIYSILITILKFKKESPTVFVFGYTSSPFFFLFNIFKIRYWVNTDGYEYHRDKFGKLAKLYLRFAEKCAVFFARKNLITDSSDLVHYFKKTYGADTKLIAYGYDKIADYNFQKDPAIKQDYDLCIQRLEPENNIKLIVDAYRYSTRTLLIIGPSTDWFSKEIEPTLPENVLYLGPVYNRTKLNSFRYFASYYVHGHSVGGMNPVLIESLNFTHIPILFLTPHNYEVYGSEAYYFYDETSLIKLLSVQGLTKNEPDFLHSRKRFEWNEVLESYIKLL